MNTQKSVAFLCTSNMQRKKPGKQTGRGSTSLGSQPWRWRQEGWEFKASLSSIVFERLALYESLSQISEEPGTGRQSTH